MNEYFQPSSVPSQNSPGTSAVIRAEFTAIAEAFNKLPLLAGKANQLVQVNPSGTALVATDILDSLATTAGLANHEADVSTHGSLGDLVGELNVQTLENKTLVVSDNNIVTAAAGNLSSTELNSALAELQGDIDTRSPSTLTVQKTSMSGAALLPTGTTAEQPGVGQFGMLRGNEDTGSLEYFTGTAWGAINGSAVMNEESFTATEGQTVFVTDAPYTVGVDALSIFINGLEQAATAYTETDNHTVTFSEGLSAGDHVEMRWGTAEYLSETDAGLVSYAPVGTGAVVTTVQTKLRESVSVKDFGAAGDGITDDTAAIQTAISNVGDGVLLIPAGTYNVASITLLNKGNADTGGFAIEGSGAIFVGGGNIILDSCKRVQINGLDAQLHNLVWRGQWWGNYTNCQFLGLIIGDAAGTSFSSSYWTDFNQCLLQKVIHSPAATSACNEISFYSCSLRGNVGQGYVATADYAFEFNANQNCQSWKFVGGDISYHNIAIYNVGVGNTAGDIELTFDGTYFDSLVPLPLARSDGRIRTINCHHANASVFAGTFSAVTCGSADLFRGDRAFKFDGTTAMNLIPNGDFNNILTTWVGAGLPIGSSGGATVTPMSGGFSGTYLNVNQANTTANTVRFRSKTLPTAGRLTGVIVLKNNDVGSKVMEFSFWGMANPEVTISNTEWTVVTVTPTTIQAAGGFVDLSVYTNDGTAFNIDVAYVGVFYGEGHEALIPSTGFRTIDYSEVYDFPSIAAGSSALKDFSIPGVALGDFVLVGKSSAMSGLLMTASVNATGTVRITLFNPSGSPVDLGIATWYIRVWKRLYI